MKLYLSATTPVEPTAAAAITRPSAGDSKTRTIDPALEQPDPRNPAPADRATKQGSR